MNHPSHTQENWKKRFYAVEEHSYANCPLSYTKGYRVCIVATNSYATGANPKILFSEHIYTQKRLWKLEEQRNIVLLSFEETKGYEQLGTEVVPIFAAGKRLFCIWQSLHNMLLQRHPCDASIAHGKFTSCQKLE
ncbi:uncharacterized protein G2W53_001200 [Senna tora]|uniref:Uncharacterized protein n=1 Tax=Senna tora TaxID=362788 RepID=A0A834XH29_9FABA|nr:uncharacterized protein G2W53_001200 [Senna tora]